MVWTVLEHTDCGEVTRIVAVYDSEIAAVLDLTSRQSNEGAWDSDSWYTIEAHTVSHIPTFG